MHTHSAESLTFEKLLTVLTKSKEQEFYACMSINNFSRKKCMQAWREIWSCINTLQC